MVTPDFTDEQEEGRIQQPECPLCGARQIQRKRDPLTRALGLILIYGSILTLLIILPGIGTGTILALSLVFLYGLTLLRERHQMWCPNCWHCRDL